MKTNLHISLILMGLILYIFIPVNSSAQLNWEKDLENNPVMQVQPGTWYSWHVFWPVVIFEDDIFKMWFCGNNQTPGRHIGYATSDDGIEWDVFDVAVLLGSPGEWDAHKYPGTVLRIDDTLRMWYSGSTNSVDNGSIGYAWSVGEQVWNIHLGPVLESGPSAWDNNAVFHPSVYYDGTMYHMHYYGSDNNFESGQIGYATSFDGINWEKDSENNPVISIEDLDGFYIDGLAPGQIIINDNRIELFFTGMDGTTSWPPYYSFWRVGYAWSTDNVNWTIHPEPVLDVGEPGTWDATIAGGPTVIIHDDYYRMWYWGDNQNSNWEIGYALGDLVGTGLPNEYKVATRKLSAYPNPSKDQVSFSYQLQAKSMVKLELFNINGQLISRLVNEVIQKGNHEVIFESSELQPGVYFCVLKTNFGTQTQKLIKL